MQLGRENRRSEKMWFWVKNANRNFCLKNDPFFKVGTHENVKMAKKCRANATRKSSIRNFTILRLFDIFIEGKVFVNDSVSMFPRWLRHILSDPKSVISDGFGRTEMMTVSRFAVDLDPERAKLGSRLSEYMDGQNT